MLGSVEPFPWAAGGYRRALGRKIPGLVSVPQLQRAAVFVIGMRPAELSRGARRLNPGFRCLGSCLAMPVAGGCPPSLARCRWGRLRTTELHSPLQLANRMYGRWAWSHPCLAVCAGPDVIGQAVTEHVRIIERLTRLLARRPALPELSAVDHTGEDLSAI